MRGAIVFWALLGLTAAACAAPYRFVTFNVWGDYFGNPPCERDVQQAAMLNDLAPDFIALQEMTANFWKSRLVDCLTNGYEVVGRKEGRDGFDSFTPLLFRKDRFVLLEKGSVLFNPELDETKGVVWAAVRDVRTGDRIVAYSTHFWWRTDGPGDDYIRLGNARRLHDEVTTAARRNSAAIVGGGDFNASPAASAIAELAKLGWLSGQDTAANGDARPSWHGYPVRGPDGVYHGTSFDIAAKTMRLDYVFYDPARVRACECRLFTEGHVEDVSDHYPVVFDFQIDPKTIFLETEAFEDWGGWVGDTQFMDQMGSPYLLAHGLGNPVADAKTKFVAKGGRYGAWVRTKNWTAPWHPGMGAGTFSLIVNGVPLSTVLGCQGNGEWLWVKADDVTLKDGENEVAIHDCDGFDGRVDVICFTTDGNPLPVLDGPRHPSRTVNRTPLPHYDVVVVGGGIAGICAAVSSSRLGLKTALVHDRPVLGGNNSSEVRVHLGAHQNIPPYPRLGDVVAEIGPKMGGNAREASVYEDDRKMGVVKDEKNLDLFLNRHVNGVVTNGNGRITTIIAQDTRFGDALRLEGALFADCTGDGTVGYLAGADWRMGREDRIETGEPDAPERADMMTMGASVQWYAGKAKGDVAFPIRSWMLKTINEANCSPHLRGDWWWETGLGRDQVEEAEYIRDYGLLVAFSNWAFVKNGYSKRDAYADKTLKWVAYNAGRRESRRLLGDFILDQNHLRNRDFQPDGTCATTWTIDLHLPKTASESKFEGEPFQTNSLNEKIWPYPIPYRCLYSRNVPNLFMAGRDISVTHVALGTTRLMRTGGMMGEVVGMAASICKKYRCNPRDVYVRHLEELKSIMRRGVGDGKAHPPQDYNLQESLNPEIRKVTD